MADYFSVVGSVVASTTALGIATWNARRSDRQRTDDARRADEQRAEDARMSDQRRNDDQQRALQQRNDDQQEALRLHHVDQLAELLRLHLTAIAVGNISEHDGEMKAILLTLPGHLATVLRQRLKLQYTVHGVELDHASRARLQPTDDQDADGKWLLFDRASSVPGRGNRPFPQWVEAELAYDIAGLRGGDQDAVLTALGHIPVNPDPPPLR